jgi:transcriptional regulator with XRE-family HTH domain
MTQHKDSHQTWLHDEEYRKEFGAESTKMETATLLATARTLTNVTQTALADKAGVSQAYIAKLERGDANPTVGHLGHLLASIWMTLEMRPVPLDSSNSIESVVLLISEPTVVGPADTDQLTITAWEGVFSSTGDSSHVIEALDVVNQ